ncbi:MAG: MFS transporter [Alphaproteobacteria bacterium]|nr:MFS transporter [Alphaproteobacteria bacterium]
MAKIKVVGVTLLGNLLEFYDLGLFGFFAPVISPLFFPTEDPLALLIASMSVFAAGFISRPLGALLFGYIGDRRGRKISLSHTILLMACPTFIISILPTYASIGILAPIILMFCRLVQGICTGGEYNNAAIFLLEHQDPKKRGFFSGMVTASAIFGFFLASSMAVFVSFFPLENSWSWRLPFLWGAFIGLVGFYLRKGTILESPVFKEMVENNSPLKISQLLKMSSKGIIATLGIGWVAGTLSLSLVGYMVSYLTSIVHLSSSQASFISNLGLLFYMLGLPIMGALSDKTGHNVMMQIACFLTTLLAYPLFCLMTSGYVPFILSGEIGLALLAAMFLGPMHAYMLEVFPAQFRCRGISTSFALGVGFLGGTAPLISTMLIQTFHFSEAPALYFILSGIAGLIATSLKVESRPVLWQSTPHFPDHLTSVQEENHPVQSSLPIQS